LTDPTQRSYVRNVTFLGDGNDFALSAAIALPMCLYLYQSARGSLARGLYIVGGLALFGAILGTQSRGAALAIIAMVFYLWTLSQNKGKATVFIIGGLIIVLAMASEAYVTRMQSIAHYQEDGSAQGRLLAWRPASEMALRRPLLGVGPGCFPLAFGWMGILRAGYSHDECTFRVLSCVGRAGMAGD
jgi:putative inorganic carbon (hco3(-)) transporter